MPLRNLFPESIFGRKLNPNAERRLRLSQARAEETIIRGHVDNALMFVDTLAEDLSFDRAIDTYIRVMGIPEPLARGEPGCGFPRPWSVYRWIDGQTAEVAEIADLGEFAAGLADFLAALYAIDPAGGPRPGTHNFFRGGSPAYYDAETRAALTALHGIIDTDLAAEVWEAALEARWDGPPVWFHGDAQPGNLLLDSAGRLRAVIDFGTSGIGDPACDTTIAWTFLSGPSQRVFRERLPVDEATWTRGRGWAIWKSMIVLAGQLDTDPNDADFTRNVISNGPSPRVESSIEPGSPNKKARLIYCGSGRKSRHPSWMPCRPRRKMTMPSTAASPCVASVARAAPITPWPGNHPHPKINKGSSRKFRITVPRTMISGILVSPTPRISAWNIPYRKTKMMPINETRMKPSAP